MSLVRTEPEPTGRANGYGVRDVVTEVRPWFDNIVDFTWDQVADLYPEAPRMLNTETRPELADIEEQSGIDTHCATGWHAALPHGTGYVVQLHRIDAHKRGTMHLLGHGMGDTMRQAVEHALVDMDRSVERGGDWVEVHALLWAKRAHWRSEHRGDHAGLFSWIPTSNPDDGPFFSVDRSQQSWGESLARRSVTVQAELNALSSSRTTETHER